MKNLHSLYRLILNFFHQLIFLTGKQSKTRLKIEKRQPIDFTEMGKK